MMIKDKVFEIFKRVKPTKTLEHVDNIIDGGYIDSFELMYLISELSQEFKIEISLDDMTVENFNSIDSIVAMIERLQN